MRIKFICPDCSFPLEISKTYVVPNAQGLSQAEAHHVGECPVCDVDLVMVIKVSVEVQVETACEMAVSEEEAEHAA